MVRIVDPGKMNVYVQFQTLSVVSDGAGGTTEPTWTTVRSFWGELLQGGQSPGMSGQSRGMRYTQMYQDYEYIINTYWFPELSSLTGNERIITDSGKTLYVRAMKNHEEKNQYITIYCAYEK